MTVEEVWEKIEAMAQAAKDIYVATGLRPHVFVELPQGLFEDLHFKHGGRLFDHGAIYLGFVTVRCREH